MDNLSRDPVLIIEPFYGGSHKQLIDVITEYFELYEKPRETFLYTLPASKWHWRARTSALYFSQIISKHNYKVLFCSSVLNLVELIGLRPDLSDLLKVIYFHENQLVYPIRKSKDRDFQYGYNQILSALAADIVIFNSHFNMDSFLRNINSHLNLEPQCKLFKRKIDWPDKILKKSKVIYFPVEVPDPQTLPELKPNVLHIIWPHRWEHDKNPELFFEVLFKLKDKNYKFLVSVLGEQFNKVPDIFLRAQSYIKDCIVNWGKLELKGDYYKCLKTGHVVVSTANHEFFGVAMLESVLCGCFPLACNSLVYPEIYPKICLYNTPNQLYKKLKIFSEKPYLTSHYLNKANIDVNKFKKKSFVKQFSEILNGR